MRSPYRRVALAWSASYAYDLVILDVIVPGLAGAGAWLLACRTLRPISEARARHRHFVADVSHEMRTPLAAIRASAEGAIAPPASEAQLGQAMGVVG